MTRSKKLRDVAATLRKTNSEDVLVCLLKRGALADYKKKEYPNGVIVYPPPGNPSEPILFGSVKWDDL